MYDADIGAASPYRQKRSSTSGFMHGEVTRPALDTVKCFNGGAKEAIEYALLMQSVLTCYNDDTSILYKIIPILFRPFR